MSLGFSRRWDDRIACHARPSHVRAPSHARRYKGQQELTMENRALVAYISAFCALRPRSSSPLSSSTMFFAKIAILAAIAATSVAATYAPPTRSFFCLGANIIFLSLMISSVTIVNNCADQIDPAIFPSADGGLGGFALSAAQQQTITLADGYSGRIWGREGCDSDGNCSSGECSGGVNCTGPAAAGPTLAQFTIDGLVLF